MKIKGANTETVWRACGANKPDTEIGIGAVRVSQGPLSRPRRGAVGLTGLR